MVKEYDWMWYNRAYVLCNYDQMYRNIYIEVTPCYSNPNDAECCTLHFLNEKIEFKHFVDAVAKGKELFIVLKKRNERRRKLESLNRETFLNIIKHSLPINWKLLIISTGLLLAYTIFRLL